MHPAKQAQPTEAGLTAKAPLAHMMMQELPMIPSAQFPSLLSWSAMEQLAAATTATAAAAAAMQGIPLTSSASLTTPRGGFDPNFLAAFPAASSFELSLQPATSANLAAAAAGATAALKQQHSFSGPAPILLPTATSATTTTDRFSKRANAESDVCLGPNDFLSMADTLVLNSILPAQPSTDLPLTQSALFNLQPTPSFMALAAQSGISLGGISSTDSDEHLAAAVADDDSMSFSSSLIDLSEAATASQRIPTREQARRAQAAEAKRKRRAKVAVPDEKKDEKYWRRREKNNEAARRNRMMKKAIDGNQKDRLPALNMENERLTDEVLLLRAELKTLLNTLRTQLLQEGMVDDASLALFAH